MVGAGGGSGAKEKTPAPWFKEQESSAFKGSFGELHRLVIFAELYLFANAMSIN
jgi:hypothetical protein